jgi:hypothetical protein
MNLPIEERVHEAVFPALAALGISPHNIEWVLSMITSDMEDTAGAFRDDSGANPDSAWDEDDEDEFDFIARTLDYILEEARDLIDPCYKPDSAPVTESLGSTP